MQVYKLSTAIDIKKKKNGAWFSHENNHKPL